MMLLGGLNSVLGWTDTRGSDDIICTYVTHIAALRCAHSNWRHALRHADNT